MWGKKKEYHPSMLIDLKKCMICKIELKKNNFNEY